MKLTGKRILALLAALTLSAAAAETVKVGNGAIELRFADGGVEVFAPGAQTPAATIKPAFSGGGEITPIVVKRPNLGYDILLLRDGKSSIAFKLEGKFPAFTMALNRGASPVRVKWNASAVVLPDRYSEDVVLAPGASVRHLPGFLNLYLGLLDDGGATLGCLPVKPGSDDAELSGDLSTLTLRQKNTEEYIFVLNSAPGAWYRAAGRLSEGKDFIATDWNVPWQASWVASFPFERDFIPAGDGLGMTWNVLTVEKRNQIKNRMLRGTMVDYPTRRFWQGGFEGTFHYPAEFIDGRLVLRLAKHNGDRLKYAADNPVYVYAWQQLPNAEASAPCLPGDFMMPWFSSERQWNTRSFSATPATCSTTADFEKIFYRDEAGTKQAEIRNMLWSMQCFVEGIRGRIENARVWASAMNKFADGELKNHPRLVAEVEYLRDMLSEIERQYALVAKRIKTPAEVERLSAEVVALAANAKLDAEEKEDRSKQLGRDIRTIGGGQDDLAARMRHIGKSIRYQALRRCMSATDPEVRDFWGRVWSDTAVMLQGAYGHDGK